MKIEKDLQFTKPATSKCNNFSSNVRKAKKGLGNEIHSLIFQSLRRFSPVSGCAIEKEKLEFNITRTNRGWYVQPVPRQKEREINLPTTADQAKLK